MCRCCRATAASTTSTTRRGTEVERDQFTVKFDYELGAGFRLAESLRYSDTQTQRNGVFPLQLHERGRFLSPARSMDRCWAVSRRDQLRSCAT